MTAFKPFVCLFMGLVLATPIAAYSQAQDTSPLNDALRQMESAGRTFKTFQARFSQTTYAAVLNEFDTPESGEFYYALASDGSALLREEFQKPGVKTLTIKGGTLTLYQPSVNQAQIVNLGKNRNKAEYLALGIGQSPAKLQETFDIQYKGTDTVNGTACWVLLLKPKSSTVSAMFSSITLWVKKSSGVPIQDKLQNPTGGDYTLITFSNEQLNKPIPASKF